MTDGGAASADERDATTPFLKLVAARRGHFRLESGHHGARWLDLDSLFIEPRRIEPFVTALAEAIRPYSVSAVCGPLLGGAFLAQLVAHALEVEFLFTERVVGAARDTLYAARYLLPPIVAPRVRDRRVAIVDDVMSAGSALRGTFAELLAHRATPVVAGALLVLGSVGSTFFAEHDVPVIAVERGEYEMWLPAACPLCAAGIPLEEVVPSRSPPPPDKAGGFEATAR